MSETVLPGDPPIPLVLRQSGRARRISLRISQLDGRVTLTIPRGVAHREALSFALEKEPWIRRHLAARGADVPVRPGAAVPVEGRMYKVVGGSGRGVMIYAGHIAVPGDPERAAVRIASTLKARARVRLAAASRRHAERLGRDFSAITLRDTRSRWGSCSSEGRLMYSWRLIMAPPEVLDYVAAHEVAHLAEMNHSAAFWRHVSTLYGDFRAARRWLRTEGGGLHRYKF